MTQSHKILVFVPPLLIGFTVLMIIFIVQHNANQAALQQAPGLQTATTSDYLISTPLPPTSTSTKPETPQSELQDSLPGDFVACTMEAKQCPDGSFVGRQGPNCEFAACPDSEDTIMCPMDVKSCPDGSFVGRTAPGCSFPACPSTTQLPYVACESSQREIDACVELYAPVCGKKQVQCVTEPCEPIPTTFPNSCFACMDAQVTGYTEGECAYEE